MTLWFDDLAEGQVLETGPREVAEADILAFAGLTGDRNQIHLDGLAHGLLVAGISSGLLFDLGHFGESTLALLELKEWRFLAPVRAGDTVRARFTVESLRLASRGDRGVVVRRAEILDQHGTVVQDGRASLLLACRPRQGPRMLSDPDRYAHAPIVGRPRLEWPEGKRLAVWIATNHEYYELESPIRPYRKPWARVTRDVQAYSNRDYGNRVGMWRLLELMDEYDITGSISWSAALGDHHPETTAPWLERGWDFFSHGIYNTRYAFGMSEDEEREMIADSFATIKRLTGQDPSGYLSPALTYTERTFDLLAEAGVKYVCDLFHDDQPFPVKVRDGRLISIPYTLELNDVYAYNVFLYPPEHYGQMIRDQFDTLYEEGNGGVMGIAIHPYLVNQPHRQKAFEDAIAYMRGFDDVWWTRGVDIADWYYDHTFDSAQKAVGA